jgi:hypothetical protein
LANSKQGTRLVEHLPLPKLKTTSLRFEEQEHTIADCPSEVLKAFVEQYTEVEDVSEKQWNDIFMRWRLINFLIDNGVLEVENGVLVEVPELQEAALAQEGA